MGVGLHGELDGGRVAPGDVVQADGEEPHRPFVPTAELGVDRQTEGERTPRRDLVHPPWQGGAVRRGAEFFKLQCGIVELFGPRVVARLLAVLVPVAARGRKNIGNNAELYDVGKAMTKGMG